MYKRILYINPTAVHGGAEEALLCFMEAAQAVDYSPVLVVPRAGWLTDRCHARNIPCELLPSLPEPFSSDTWREQLQPWLINGIAIAQLARKWQAALVHSNTPRSSYHGGLGARLAGLPAVTHVHDIVSLPYESRVKSHILTALADYTLVPSNAVEQVVCSLAPQINSRIQTLYYGWNHDRYNLVQSANLPLLFDLPPEALCIGTVAAMTPWKGQDILIEAFKLTHRIIPNARLLIVGGSQGGKQQFAFEAQLRRQVADAGLNDAVIFTGWREDVWDLIKSLDIFVHIPTQPDPLPTALLHACALNRAIIASNTGGIPEIVADGTSGLVVPPSDSVSVHNALVRLIFDESLRKRLGEQAKENFIQSFNERRMIEGVAKVYEYCLRSREAAA